MPATLDEVKQLIRDAFPGSSVDELVEVNHRVVGNIRWQDFKNKDVSERNHLVTEKIRNTLGLRGVNVGVLFPLAPGEDL